MGMGPPPPSPLGEMAGDIGWPQVGTVFAIFRNILRRNRVKPSGASRARDLLFHLVYHRGVVSATGAVGSPACSAGAERLRRACGQRV